MSISLGIQKQQKKQQGKSRHHRSEDEHLSLPSYLTIERVSDGEMLKTWLRIMTVGSEIPEEALTLLLDAVTNHGFRDDAAIHYYLAASGSQPVAASWLYLVGVVAGFYTVA